MNKCILFILLAFYLPPATSHAQTSRWYSYAQYLTNEGYFVDSTKLTIWSDTSALIPYGVPATYLLNHMTSAAMSFSPVLSTWNDPALFGSTIAVGPTDAYTIDSVRIRGSYFRNNAKTTPIDTIFISFVYGNGTTSSNLQFAYFASAWAPFIMTDYGTDTLSFFMVDCDTVKDVASNFPGISPGPYVQYITLTHTDTATNFDRYIKLTTPFPVPAGNSAVMSLSFKSGDASFTHFDTVLYASGAAKYGLFQPRLKYNSDGAGTPQFAPYSRLDSNAGFFKDGSIGADQNGWTGVYIPMWAWNSAGGASALQYPDFDFHISCPTCSSTNPISGTAHVCVGAATSLSSSPGGGTWSSSNTGIATVGSTTGLVTGVSGGTVNISYTTSGSSSYVVVTVNTLPTVGSITGGSAVCVTDSILLADSPTGGTWSSSVPSVATVTASTGWVTGVGVGIAGISYTASNSCGSTTVVHIVTVNVFGAGSVSGIPSLCTGASYTFTDGVASGVWSSSSTGVATVNSGGMVTGISTGTATISYTVTNACGTADATAVVSVDVAPAVGPITGTLTLCSGLTTPLTDATPGGTWSSITPGVATIGTSGTVTGVSAGISAISYTITSGCGASAAIAIVTVTATPVASGISGPSAVCIGSSITLTDASPGGTWTSGSTGIATIGSTTGFVTGIAAGTARITYTISNSCGTATTTTNIAVSTAPSAGTITGATNLCVTTSTTLSDLVTGGTWNATNGHAFISSTGTVLGVTAGVDTMIYTVTSTCATTSTAIATLVLTVNPAPDAGSITGPDSVCITHSITLSDAISGGTWTASNSNAFVSSTGVVLGVTIGTDNVTYTTTNFCGSASAEALITISDCTTGTINLPINEYTLYPNPAQNNITITASTNIEKVLISNIFGQEVFVGKYNSQNIMINIDRLIAGVYLIKINDAKVYKLIKQ